MAEAESSGEGLNSFLFSQEAADDLWKIWIYAAEQGGIAIANRIESTIVEKILLLVQFPEIGHWRRDLTTQTVKFFPVYCYMIVYRPTTKPLQIVAILHGRRDVEEVLRLRL